MKGGLGLCGVPPPGSLHCALTQALLPLPRSPEQALDFQDSIPSHMLTRLQICPSVSTRPPVSPKGHCGDISFVF